MSVNLDNAQFRQFVQFAERQANPANREDHGRPFRTDRRSARVERQGQRRLRQSMMKRFVFIVAAATACVLLSVLRQGEVREAPAATAEERGGASAPWKAGGATCFFADFRSGSWVEGDGVVKKVLPDDTTPPCHQRLLVADPTGRTVLIAHNIDSWGRLKDVKAGDRVAFRGEFIDNERGGVVHWTHPDPRGRKPGGGGWLRKVRR